ncbi:Putative carboxypeptidase [Ignavibacterium album JCM 16511]|uniref:carboxypeptidase T n=1 Tax=Ignavibacterium album (strain DSM 19864 / JCM 16511 / NBRC 101810 / Mat9-16) TaxID=945713 RepID=I0AND0_IGNAJ|nr:M14 family zinc carboxypeptidase [Ignavibacterium album]AFH50487.1 Putative carboxypeptidase [Ignavibacterium album JCM 16511]
MFRLFTIILLLLVALTISAQNYKEVKIYLDSQEQLSTLFNMGLEFDHFKWGKDNSITTFISDREFEILQNSSFRYDVLIDDWNTYYANLPKLSESEKQFFRQMSKENYNVEGFGYGSMGGFFTLNEINARLDSMYILYPNIITQKFQIGTTVQGRPIYAVKISDNPNVNEDEPQVQFNALIHAREPQAMMTIMYYMYYLLENYGTDPEVTYLINNREIYFIPCINPDGYEYNRQTNPSGGGMWRKNRKQNGDGSYGVDLNRNFAYMWGINNTGSSGTPSSETYRGTAPFSEPETQAIRDFTNSKNFKTTLNYHTYSNLLLYPWGYVSTPTPDNAIFVEYSTDMVAYNGYENGQPPIILYDVNGSADDWMYGEQTTKPKIFAMTPEVGSTGFWPSQGEIYPLAIENLMPNLYITWVAGAYVSVINPSFSQQYFNPGDNVQLLIPSVRNKGLSNAQNVTLTLTSDNPEITITNGTINVGNVAARSTLTLNQNFAFTIGNIPADVNVKMMITTLTDGTPMRVDTLKFIVGTPVLLLADTTNNINTLWTLTRTPTSAPLWGVTTASYHSAPNSYTDSPSGQYIDNSTTAMTLTDALNLSSYSNPKLSFWTKWDIENSWDCGQVKFSTNNGVSWIPLQGLYTNAASGQGAQTPAGEPIYDATQTNWVQEEISLSGLTSSQNKLRFELRTDGSVTKDGWYVDDIGIYIYAVVPVELSSFTATALENSVELQWITSSETNNSGFEIQRKVLGENSEWTKIGFVKGSGTSTETNAYSFVDKNPSRGINLYRLKQIDYDGSYKIFNSVAVNFNLPVKFALEQNYPNPFNPSTTIQYAVGSRQLVQLKVYNVLGNEIATLVNEYKEPGNYKVEFNGGDLPSGIYYYKLSAGNYSDVKKMMLIK